MIVLTPKTHTLYYVAFAERENDIKRIISLRKATRQEVRHYVKTIEA
jgi:uncharacterized DUF497 family protein